MALENAVIALWILSPSTEGDQISVESAYFIITLFNINVYYYLLNKLGWTYN